MTFWEQAQQLGREGRMDLAGPLAWRSIQEDPACHYGWAIYGGYLVSIGQFEDALRACDRALQIAPDMPAARWNRAHALMGLGEWREGWVDYQTGRINKLRITRSVLPVWDGSRIEGQTLFVWGEQGLGDVIQYLRFIRLVKEISGAQIILEVPSALVEVCVQNGLADLVFAQTPDRHMPFHADKQVALLDVPYVLGLGREHIQGTPYLESGVDDRYSGKVGFCWKGSTTHVNDANRSMNDDEAKSFRCKGLVSMQYGCALPGQKVKFEPEGMHETAAALKALKCLVTVDTSIAHLAGALGVPTYLLVPTTNEPRWETHPTQTVWYDSITLVRTKPSEGLKAGLARIRGMIDG